MAKKPDLNKLSLLIVDPDVRLAEVCAQSLRTMGFGLVTQVRNAPMAIEFIRKNPTDIVITESPMEGGSGLQMIRDIRSMDDFSKRIISIILLTAQAELDNVKTARDVGINEFMVKPFTANTLFARLEQVIEHPRSFVFANAFVGPDRRRREANAPEGNKRRETPRVRRGGEPVLVNTPSAVLPDFTLKKKIELEGKLASVVTPEIVMQAQATIESFKTQSQDWIQEDVQALMAAQKRLALEFSPPLLEEMMRLCLSIKGRAGMFGHGIVSEVAQLFYQFLQGDYHAANPQHPMIAGKYTEALYAAFISNMTMRDIKMGQALVQDLKRLSRKFAEA